MDCLKVYLESTTFICRAIPKMRTLKLFLVTQLCYYAVLQQVTSLPVGSPAEASSKLFDGTSSEAFVEKRVPRAEDDQNATEELNEDQETAAEHIYHANMGKSHCL